MTRQPEQKIFGTIRDDLQRGDFGQTIRRDFEELREYMLEEERKQRLSEMNPLKRWFVLAWWLLKSLFFKLPPTRRLLLMFGLIFVVLSRTVAYPGSEISVSLDLHSVGILLILFVLMLELKDKLVAHDELKAGRSVQQALMPDRMPSVPGWELWLFTRSANEVGGDLVDFMKITKDRFGVAVGDVAGKGLSAALLMAKLQATLRALVADSPSLAGLGSTINQIFFRDGVKSIFSSLVYVELQPNSGSLRLVNAGHVLPVVVRQTRIERLEKGGVAIGIMPDAAFEEQTVELARGDTFLIYSDGVTEAQNERGEFFGDQQLMEFLTRVGHMPGQQMGERLVAEVDRFVGEARAHDDLSVALIRKV